MAARTRRIQHDDRTRERIRTAAILNRLQDFAMGKERQGKPVEMTPAQVNAAQIVLRKSLPDLTAVALTGKDGGAVTIVLGKSDQGLL